MQLNWPVILAALLIGIAVGFLLGKIKPTFFQRKSWQGENKSLGVNQFKQKSQQGIIFFDIYQNDRGRQVHALVKFEKGRVKLAIPTIGNIITYTVFAVETTHFWYTWDQQKKNAGERTLNTLIRMRKTLVDADSPNVKLLRVDASLNVAKIDF